MMSLYSDSGWVNVYKGYEDESEGNLSLRKLCYQKGDLAMA